MNLLKTIQTRITRKLQTYSKIHKSFIDFWKTGIEPVIESQGFDENGKEKPRRLIDYRIREEFINKIKQENLIKDIDLFKKDIHSVIRRTMFREKVRDHSTGETTGCMLCKERIMRNAFLNVFLKYLNTEDIK